MRLCSMPQIPIGTRPMRPGAVSGTCLLNRTTAWRVLLPCGRCRCPSARRRPRHIGRRAQDGEERIKGLMCTFKNIFIDPLHRSRTLALEVPNLILQLETLFPFLAILRRLVSSQQSLLYSVELRLILCMFPCSASLFFEATLRIRHLLFHLQFTLFIGNNTPAFDTLLSTPRIPLSNRHNMFWNIP